MKFTTPWPKQSYHYATDVSKNYSKKFSALSSSISLILFFLFSTFVSSPSALQDLVISIVSTTVMGYTVLIHLQLFNIFPVLIVIPSLFIAVCIHFLASASKEQRLHAKTKLLRESAKMEESLRKRTMKQQHRQLVQQQEQATAVKEDDVRESTMDGDEKQDTHLSEDETITGRGEEYVIRHVTRKQSVQYGLAIAKEIKHTLKGNSFDDPDQRGATIQHWKTAPPVIEEDYFDEEYLSRGNAKSKRKKMLQTSQMDSDSDSSRLSNSSDIRNWFSSDSEDDELETNDDFDDRLHQPIRGYQPEIEDYPLPSDFLEADSVELETIEQD